MDVGDFTPGLPEEAHTDTSGNLALVDAGPGQVYLLVPCPSLDTVFVVDMLSHCVDPYKSASGRSIRY